MAKYEIIGNKKVMEKVKGDIITIDDEQVAKSLIKGGHIKPTKITKSKKKRARNENELSLVPPNFDLKPPLLIVVASSSSAVTSKFIAVVCELRS